MSKYRHQKREIAEILTIKKISLIIPASPLDQVDPSGLIVHDHLKIFVKKSYSIIIIFLRTYPCRQVRLSFHLFHDLPEKKI